MLHLKPLASLSASAQHELLVELGKERSYHLDAQPTYASSCWKLRPSPLHFSTQFLLLPQDSSKISSLLSLLQKEA